MLDRLPDRVVNLHIAYLPYNRGADPNLWSVLEDTPAGVSIHYVDEGVDTGDIIAQRRARVRRRRDARQQLRDAPGGDARAVPRAVAGDPRRDLRAAAADRRGHEPPVADRAAVEHLLAGGWDTPARRPTRSPSRPARVAHRARRPARGRGATARARRPASPASVAHGGGDAARRCRSACQPRPTASPCVARARARPAAGCRRARSRSAACRRARAPTRCCPPPVTARSAHAIRRGMSRASTTSSTGCEAGRGRALERRRGGDSPRRRAPGPPAARATLRQRSASTRDETSSGSLPPSVTSMRRATRRRRPRRRGPARGTRAAAARSAGRAAAGAPGAGRGTRSASRAEVLVEHEVGVIAVEVRVVVDDEHARAAVDERAAGSRRRSGSRRRRPSAAPCARASAERLRGVRRAAGRRVQRATVASRPARALDERRRRRRPSGTSRRPPARRRAPARARGSASRDPCRSRSRRRRGQMAAAAHAVGILLVDVRVDRRELRMRAHVGDDRRRAAAAARRARGRRTAGAPARGPAACRPSSAGRRRRTGRRDGVQREQVGALGVAEPRHVLARRRGRREPVDALEHVAPQRLGVEPARQVRLEDVGGVVDARGAPRARAITASVSSGSISGQSDVTRTTRSAPRLARRAARSARARRARCRGASARRGGGERDQRVVVRVGRSPPARSRRRARSARRRSSSRSSIGRPARSISTLPGSRVEVMRAWTMTTRCTPRSYGSPRRGPADTGARGYRPQREDRCSSPAGPARSGPRSCAPSSRRYDVASIRVFSRDELKQSELAAHASTTTALRSCSATCATATACGVATRGVDVIVHAAALKQVPACEYNPFEAVQTNVIGAENVIAAAIDNDVPLTIALSTDKAVNPVNLYGATKLCAEKIVAQAQRLRGRRARRASRRCATATSSAAAAASIPLFKQQARDRRADDHRRAHDALLDHARARPSSSCSARSRSMQGGEIVRAQDPEHARSSTSPRRSRPSAERRIVGIRPGREAARGAAHRGRGAPLLRPRRPLRDPARTLATWRHRARRSAATPLPDGFRYASDTNDQWLGADELRAMAERAAARPPGGGPRRAPIPAGRRRLSRGARSRRRRRRRTRRCGGRPCSRSCPRSCGSQPSAPTDSTMPMCSSQTIRSPGCGGALPARDRLAGALAPGPDVVDAAEALAGVADRHAGLAGGPGDEVGAPRADAGRAGGGLAELRDPRRVVGAGRLLGHADLGLGGGERGLAGGRAAGGGHRAAAVAPGGRPAAWQRLREGGRASPARGRRRRRRRREQRLQLRRCARAWLSRLMRVRPRRRLAATSRSTSAQLLGGHLGACGARCTCAWAAAPTRSRSAASATSSRRISRHLVPACAAWKPVTPCSISG